MTALTVKRFDDYFRELHGPDPYSWQRRLATQAVEGEWPPAIDLPTGSGKTACIDVAVFALACQSGWGVKERNSPRRVFFCVNRRVIVDEAYQRATRIAEAIWQAERAVGAEKPTLREVAAALRLLAGTTADSNAPPLDVLELRGGIYHDNRWARSATQPTIVCTTIDQLGSRLLFRGYGVSPNAAPIQAALIAYDSLVLLDEAHISEPFRQTLEYVQRYLDPERWTEQEIGVRPVLVVPMTATPPLGVNAGGILRLDDADRGNESLNNRLRASKPAELCEVKDVAAAAVEAADKFANGEPTVIGIMVNRIKTAREIYVQLRKEHPDAVVELVIGSMRPVDRDEQAKRLRRLVGPERPAVSTQINFVIATQCLEVGADYDFDVLITECASLDALRQRFGRLQRGGRTDKGGRLLEGTGLILIARENLKANEKLDDEKPLDPIYGNAMARTWNWLKANDVGGGIDFGIEALGRLLGDRGEGGRIPKALLAPSATENAPVLLPAYIDLWCQTEPRPEPDPDVSLFLHGARRGEPEVQVCWRADLGERDGFPQPEQWDDVVALLPPTAAECMSVPISRVRRWLSGEEAAIPGSEGGDLLGVPEGTESDEGERHAGGKRVPATVRRALLWRGVDGSVLLGNPSDLRPGDTIVLPVSAGGWDEIGHIPPTIGREQFTFGAGDVDRAEWASAVARDRAILRIHPALRSTWPDSPAVDALFGGITVEETISREEVARLAGSAADALDRIDPHRARLLRALSRQSNIAFEEYPDGRGAVLASRRRLGLQAVWMSVLDDGADQTSHTGREAVHLRDHCAHVEAATRRTFGLVPASGVMEACALAARLHDFGKADERFQAMLVRAARTDVWMMAGRGSALLAKSAGFPPTRSERRAARRRAGLPEGFRHEMLSVQFAEQYAGLPTNPVERSLVLHLIATHHGYGRPFAPVAQDDHPPDVEVDGMRIGGHQRLSAPLHRLNSGVAERFWILTRHFGWWGLAFVESLLRLADWQASADEEAGVYAASEAGQHEEAIE